MADKILTAERLREKYHYDPATGDFTHVKANGEFDAGDAAGWVNTTRGIVLLGVDGTVYRGHRLAWLYMTGDWPPEDVIFENGVKHDIRWANINHHAIA